MPHAIGIDLGTTNVKVVLTSANGTVTGSATRALDMVERGDVVEQDAEQIWDKILDCLGALTCERPRESARVEVIGVCSQYSSIVGVDRMGKPTTPLVMWSDQRGSDHSWAIISRHEDAFTTWTDRHGIPPVGGGLSLAHLLHLQIDRPASHSRTHAYLEPMDYIVARLTGTICATQPSSFMAQLCDNRKLGVVEYDPDLVSMSGVDPTRLAHLVDIESVIGPILPSVADATGLSTNVVVAPGTNDTAAVGIASGAFDPGISGVAIGTTSVIVDTLTEFRTDLEHEIVSIPGPFRDTYLVMAENGLGGRVLEHMVTRIVDPDDALDSSTVNDPFAAVAEALGTSPPGSGGVMFLPWLAGSLAPSSNRSMRGGFVNMSLDTTRVDMVRSVTEGIAHNLGWLLPHVESMAGHVIDQIRFTGGGARIVGWAQVIADILNRSVAVVDQPHLSAARAAALLALQRTKVLTRTDLSDSVAVGEVHDPASDHRALYDHRQSQFEACFEALQPIHTALGGTP